MNEKMFKKEQMKALQKSGVRYFGERKGTNVSNNNTLFELEELAAMKETTTPRSGMRTSQMATRPRNTKEGSKMEDYKFVEDD